MKLAALGLAVCLTAGAAMKLDVKELVQFITSSIDLGHRDGKVAKYLKNVTLTEMLDDRTIETLQGIGAGPKTVQALRRIRDESARLPQAAPPEPERKAPSRPPPSIEEQDRIIDEVRTYASLRTIIAMESPPAGSAFRPITISAMLTLALPK